MRVETYQLFAENGKPIRKATKVVFITRAPIYFMERLPKKIALKQAEEIDMRETKTELKQAWKKRQIKK